MDNKKQTNEDVVPWVYENNKQIEAVFPSVYEQ
jgi:hypothetical protein